FSTNGAILNAFYPEHIEEIPVTEANRDRFEGAMTVEDVIDPETGELYLESLGTFGREHVDKMIAAGIKTASILHLQTAEQDRGADPLIVASLREDPTNTH